jgi:hypothetical protein
MRYYLFACTENGNPGESPTTLGLTMKPYRLDYAAWMIDSEGQPDIVDVLQFTAPTLGWLDNRHLDEDTGISITLAHKAERIISDLEADDRFSRPENMVERIKDSPKTILREAHSSMLEMFINMDEEDFESF